MACNKEFILEWNTTFTYKIRNVHLQKPTEAFLTSALECFLIKMNINLPMLRYEIYSTDVRGQLRFKIDLCRYIDQLYKISAVSNNFLYYDLVHPGSKKTIHLLKILLNYFKFKRMVHDEVVEVSTSKIRELELNIVTRNKFLVENEKAKAHASNIDRKLAELMVTIPQLQNTVDKLTKDRAELNEQIEHSNEKISTLKYSALNLWKSVHELQSEVVSESELNEVENSTKSTADEIEKCTLNNEQAMLYNQEVAVKLKHLMGCMESIQAALEKYKDDSLTSSFELATEQIQLQRQLDDIEAKERSLISDIKVKTAESVAIKSVLAVRTGLQLRNESELRALKRKRLVFTIDKEDINKKLEKKVMELADLEDERAFIDEHGPEVLEKVRNSSS